MKLWSALLAYIPARVNKLDRQTGGIFRVVDCRVCMSVNRDAGPDRSEQTRWSCVWARVVLSVA